MIFESLWPLALLFAVPVVIILYLLKPRGKDYRISSNLLWDKLFKNQQSKTFLEKFIHNILMYLQILIIMLLVLALMSPYIHGQGRSGGNVILVLDTSGSMQHDAGNGNMRIEEAVEQAKGLIAASEETAFSIVTNDCLGTNLLAVGVKDKDSLYTVLNQIECCDGDGNLQDAESVVETLRSAGGESGENPTGAEVILYTDGNGAEDAMGFSEYFDAQVLVMGSAVSNVSNNFLSYVDAVSENAADDSYGNRTENDNAAEDVYGDETENGSGNAAEGSYGEGVGNSQGDISENVRRIICASSITNYSDAEATMEISLYEGKKLLEVRQLTLGAGETTLCFFNEIQWENEPLRSEISSVKFAGKDDADSLAADNVAYAIPDQADRIEAVLVGDGNLYIEKAYQAATGMNLTRVKSESVLGDTVPEDTTQEGAMQGSAAQEGTAQKSAAQSGGQTVRIYDAGTESNQQNNFNSLIFGGGEGVTGTAERVALTVTSSDLTSGLSSFSIGVNQTKVYEIPDWGIGFLWAGEQCAGYYGEHDGVKTVVVGFDIRESDFPLMAEFPIFISNAIRYLGDNSLLADNIYMAGDKVMFHPQADFDVNTLEAETGKAGLYEVNADDITEQYVVRFATGSQSDGQLVAEGTVSDTEYGSGLVKRQLRNIVLALILFLMVIEWILYVRQMRYRGKFYLAVRIAGMVMLLMALFGVAVSRRSGTNTTIFLVDISNSNEQNLQDMEAYLDDALDRMPGGNQYGIVTFGKNSLVEQFLTGEDHFSQIMSLPDKTATNFEDAMLRAFSMIPADGAGRVVILTDGRETKGNLANTASALISRQIELLAFVYGTEQQRDAYVENVELPSLLYQGDAYSMTVTVESSYETDAQLQIWMGTMQTQAYDVHLNRGTNQFKLRQMVAGENIESFEVKIAAPGDMCQENDSYHVYSVVDSAPKVLLVSGMKEDSSEYENLLRSANCNYQRVSAINAPSALEGMLEYKSIILENVYLSDLPEGFLANIETYVMDYGCGLICCGGDESYALGGYRESVLETVLPVDMELRGVDEIPKTAIIMVIDHSGSMGVDAGGGATSLDLAITAAKTAVDQMRSSDYVGVVTFDDSFSWVVEPTLVSDRGAIKEKIETIAEGGGTTIKPALWAALSGVAECDVSIRHVILLTDGQGESNNYSDITAAYTSGNVTLSTVAVGSGSDARLLEQIANSCGGRYYYSDIVTDIPKIFAQEVFLSGDTYLQNGDFALAVNSRSEITQGLFETGWPNIYGYVSATPKNGASVLISSEKDDPVLTVMQYGLGHTVAWNTDVTNQWTAGYARADDYVQLWKRILDYSAGNANIGGDSVDVVTAGGYTNIVYNALDYGEQTRVEAVYTDPEGNTWTKTLQATAPGRFEAGLDTDMTGIYNLSVRRIDEGEIANAITTAAAVQYSDEYKFDVSTAAFTGFVERYGKILEPEENFWQQRKSNAREKYELTKWLLLLALLWFVMDIALRRFHFRPQDTRLYHAVSRWRLQRKSNSYGKALANMRTNPEGGVNAKAQENIQMQADAEARTNAKAQADTEAKTGAKAQADTEVQTNAEIRTGTSSQADPVRAKDQVKKKKPKKADKKQEQQTLDTSALLKKKDQRNQ